MCVVDAEGAELVLKVLKGGIVVCVHLFDGVSAGVPVILEGMDSRMEIRGVMLRDSVDGVSTCVGIVEVEKVSITIIRRGHVDVIEMDDLL